MSIENEDTSSEVEDTATGTEDTGSDTGAGSEEKAAEKATEEKSESGDTDKGDTKEKSEDKPGDEDKAEDDKEKSDDDKSEDEDKDEDKPEGAPEEYDDFKMPEGFDVDKDRVAQLHEYGKKHNLSQEAAQELVDLHSDAVKEAAVAQQDQWDKIKDTWKKETLANKDMQDEEGKAEPNVAIALKAVEALGGDELKEAFDLTGAGNHPAVVLAFYKIGKGMQEDGFSFGSGSNDSRSVADKMYPSMSKKKK